MAAYANVAPRVSPDFVPPRGCGRRHMAPKRAASWRASSAFSISRVAGGFAGSAREFSQTIEMARKISRKKVLSRNRAARSGPNRHGRGQDAGAIGCLKRGASFGFAPEDFFEHFVELRQARERRHQGKTASRADTARTCAPSRPSGSTCVRHSSRPWNRGSARARERAGIRREGRGSLYPGATTGPPTVPPNWLRR